MTMKFPLADWIDEHNDCQHNLGTSGMRGSIRHPVPSAAEVRSADAGVLRREFAELLGVDAGRIFLTHGATEGNAAVLWFLARRYRGRRLRCRVRFPEYPPLFDVARWAGFELTGDREPATIAVVSQPRNPEGDLWSRDRLQTWADRARSLLVDETFREFAHRPSVARTHGAGVWVTGTLTKFYAADDLRVGFVVAPEAERSSYERFHGLVFDEIPPASLAGALVTLRARERIRRDVERVLQRNRVAFAQAFPRSRLPQAPVFFDRNVDPDGTSFANQCLSASVLVCPGSFFGDPSGVRLGLTRRSFPRDLAAYLRVREASKTLRPVRVRERSASRTAPPRRGGSVPRTAGRA
jgi:histidinol-phosphate/aromatic aminotransferase/cobyric acid decarboxylase-like protein